MFSGNKHFKATEEQLQKEREINKHASQHCLQATSFRTLFLFSQHISNTTKRITTCKGPQPIWSKKYLVTRGSYSIRRDRWLLRHCERFPRQVFAVHLQKSHLILNHHGRPAPTALTWSCLNSAWTMQKLKDTHMNQRQKEIPDVVSKMLTGALLFFFFFFKSSSNKTRFVFVILLQSKPEIAIPFAASHNKRKANGHQEPPGISINFPFRKLNY